MTTITQGKLSLISNDQGPGAYDNDGDEDCEDDGDVDDDGDCGDDDDYGDFPSYDSDDDGE